MSDSLSRRRFLAAAGGLVAGASVLDLTGCTRKVVVSSALDPRAGVRGVPYRIGLAEYSLHREIAAKRMDHLDLAKVARQDFGIEAIEYWNSPWKDKAQDAAYLADMNKRAADHGVVQHLIMVDGEGRLGDPNESARIQAVENHRKWLHAARELGCITIRVNAASEGSYEEQQKLAADGLHRLSVLGEDAGINVIVENHGGLSSNGKWLSGVMRLVNHRRCGTLPDFGNFNLGNGQTYDLYMGIAELMPFAKAVSAKSHDFDDATGEETTKDYHRIMKIVTDAGYHSWVSIEYEGNRLPEREGIMRTMKLLERVRAELD